VIQQFQQWEYQVQNLHIGKGDIEAQLNTQGKKGWELVNMAPNLDYQTGKHMFYLTYKRPVPPAAEKASEAEQNAATP